MPRPTLASIRSSSAAFPPGPSSRCRWSRTTSRWAPSACSPAATGSSAPRTCGSRPTPRSCPPLRGPMPGPAGAPGGAFCVARRAERPFSADEARIADALSAQLPVALSNARLYAEERTRAEEMTSLYELSRSVAGSLEIVPLLNAAGERLRKLVDATNWFVLLLDEGKKTLRNIACSPQHSEYMRDVVLHVSESSIALEAVRTRRPEREGNPEQTPRASPHLVSHFYERALLAVPLIARDEVLGAVMLDD